MGIGAPCLSEISFPTAAYSLLVLRAEPAREIEPPLFKNVVFSLVLEGCVWCAATE